MCPSINLTQGITNNLTYDSSTGNITFSNAGTYYFIMNIIQITPAAPTGNLTISLTQNSNQVSNSSFTYILTSGETQSITYNKMLIIQANDVISVAATSFGTVSTINSIQINVLPIC